MSDEYDLGAIKRRAQAAYGGRRRPASPSEVLALVEAVEALRKIADRTTPMLRRTNGEWAEVHERHEAVARAALARFRWEDTP